MKMFHKVLGSSAVAAALAIGASTTQAQIVNGGFENAGQFAAGNPIGLAGVNQGWASDFGGNPPVQSTDFAHTGTYSLLAQNAAGNSWNPQGSYQVISANGSAGNAWTASLWALTDTGTLGNSWAPNQIIFQVNFLDAALANVAPFTELVAPIAALNTWQQFSLNGVVPAGTQYMSIYAMHMIGLNATGPVNVYFDDVAVTGVPEPTTFALAGLGAAALLIFRRRS